MPEHQPPPRLLLPFTHGVKMEALDSAILLALIRVKAKLRRPEPHLEQVLQAKDFLEAVRWKGARYGVPIARFEVLTEDVVQSLDVLTKQLSCSGMVLFVREGRGVLLNTDEIVCILEQGNCTCYIVHLPVQKHLLLDSLLTWLSAFLSWVPKRMVSPSGQPAIPQSPEPSQRPRRAESRREEVRTEDLTEDQRIQSHG